MRVQYARTVRVCGGEEGTSGVGEGDVGDEDRAAVREEERSE